MSAVSFKQSIEVLEQLRTVVPSGANSPGRLFSEVETPALVIKQGQGATVEDIDGNKYIDFVMGLGPCILGHSPSGVVDALSKQFECGTVYGMSSSLEYDLAALITASCECVDQLRFTCSGTEAVMTALRVARAHTGKPAILKFAGGYHGHSDSVLVQMSKGSFHKKNNSVLDGIHSALSHNTFLAQYNDVEAAADIVKRNHEQIAAIILEPVATNMGLVLPEKAFLKALRELCDQYDILLIFDEVVSGFRFRFGNVSTMFDVEPDLITLGKIIGGGLAIGAYGGRADVMDAVSQKGGVFQGGTFSGNPLTMAAGLATLDVLQRPAFYDDIEAKAALFADITRQGFEANGLKLSIQQFGSLASYIFNQDLGNLRSLEDVRKQDTSLFARFHLEMTRRGILFPPTIEEPIFFSSAHTEEQIEYAAQTGVEIATELLIPAN